MDNTIEGIEYVEITADEIIKSITKLVNEFDNKEVQTPKLFLTSREIFLLKFEGMLNNIISKFNISKKDYKRYKKLVSKLMFMILEFRDRE